jgi:PAS domain S-box-containing protein
MERGLRLPCGCSVPAPRGWAGLVDPASDLLLLLDGTGLVRSGFPHESELAQARLCQSRVLDELFAPALASLLLDRTRVVHATRECTSIDVEVARPEDGARLPVRVRLSPDGEVVLVLMHRQGTPPRVDPREPTDDSSFWQLFEAAPIPLAVEVATDAHGEGVSRLNRKFTAVFGYGASDVQSVQHWWPLAYPDPTCRERVRQEWFRRVREASPRGEAPTMETTVVCKDGSEREIEFGLSVIGDRHVVSFVDVTESRRSQRALEAHVEELRAALEEITQLRKLLRVCAWCRKVRDDHGEWLAVEEFVAQSPDLTLTHGICPDCRARHLKR